MASPFELERRRCFSTDLIEVNYLCYALDIIFELQSFSNNPLDGYANSRGLFLTFSPAGGLMVSLRLVACFKGAGGCPFV
jgi:hypothetical protein